MHIQKVAVVPSAVGDVDGVRYDSAKIQDSVHLDPPEYLPRFHSAGLTLQGIVVESIAKISHSEMVDILDVLLRGHRTDFLYQPQAKRLEDPASLISFALNKDEGATATGMPKW